MTLLKKPTYYQETINPNHNDPEFYKDYHTIRIKICNGKQKNSDRIWFKLPDKAKKNHDCTYCIYKNCPERNKHNMLSPVKKHYKKNYKKITKQQAIAQLL